MLIRTERPKFYLPEFKPFNSPIKDELSNGIKLFYFNSGHQEVFKIDLIFQLGIDADLNPAIPGLCLEMLREGSKNKSAVEINNTLDYYGAFLDFKYGLDNTIISLYGRSVFIKELIPLLAEIVFEPTFNKDAITKHKERITQKLLINQKKTSYWAPRLLRKSIFGTDHFYSKLLSTDEISNISQNDLNHYHKNHLLPKLQSIIVAGSYPGKEVEKLLQHNLETHCITSHVNDITIPKPELIRHVIKQLENTSQASIAIGKQAMDISTNSYPKYAFLTKVLGGYFGSRLMKKLREQEGLTYGIHAYNIELKSGSYLQISTDVKLDSVDKSVELILAEIDKLQMENISLQEVNTVQNYMIGEFVNESNTVFDFAELYKKILLQNLPEDYYEVFYNNISAVQPEELKYIALNSLKREQLSIIKAL